jgi:hypothetical protein
LWCGAAKTRDEKRSKDSGDNMVDGYSRGVALR